MFDLPKSTEYGKRIPKQKFYEKLDVSPAVKKAFSEQIKIIYWRNKIAASTMNLAPGETVTEIEILEIRLRVPKLDDAVLRTIDREIPYHLVFLLEYESTYRAVIGYKEAAGSGRAAFKVERYYRTDWLTAEELSLTPTGLTTDAVYENYVRQIAGAALIKSEDSTLKNSVENEKERGRLRKEIAALEAKIRKEPQLNRQMEINANIKKLKTKLFEISEPFTDTKPTVKVNLTF